MTLRLRAHHLLCLLTYVGKGYTPAFVAHYDKVVARLEAGEAVELVEGPDEICAPMLADGHHCFNASIKERDAQAREAVALWLGRSLETGARLALDAATIARLRAGFAEGTIRAACLGCQWAPLCDDIAASGFRAVRLHGEHGAPGLSPPSPCGIRPG